MTLLERLSGFPPPDYEDYWLTADEVKQIRRALAIAQAVEEWHQNSDGEGGFLLRRADELLEAKR